MSMFHGQSSVDHRTVDTQTGVLEVTENDYLLSLCARHLGEPFLDFRLAEMVLQSITWAKKQFKWRVFSFCLMPDHLHIACRLTNVAPQVGRVAKRIRKESVILDQIAKFKNSTTTGSWNLGITGRLFDHSECEPMLEIGQPLEEIVLFVLNNPVRRELVRDWPSWPHSKRLEN